MGMEFQKSYNGSDRQKSLALETPALKIKDKKDEQQNK
ncbi:hypothetical protein M145_4710 [Bacteroides fragilis str. 34-F-2 |nr:hypothetical protein M077_3775 [Bacteroides fragilis str. 2-F-2 \